MPQQQRQWQWQKLFNLLGLCRSEIDTQNGFCTHLVCQKLWLKKQKETAYGRCFHEWLQHIFWWQIHNYAINTSLTSSANGPLPSFLGGLSLHLNHLIASRVANYDWPFGTLPFGLFGSNWDTRDLETYPRTYSGHFWNMSIFDDSRAIWVLFRKWVVSENQSFLDEGVIVTPLSVEF